MAPLLELPSVVVGGMAHKEVHSGQSKQAAPSGNMAEVLSWLSLCSWQFAGGLSTPNLQPLLRVIPNAFSICMHFPMHTNLINFLSFRQL